MDVPEVVLYKVLPKEHHFVLATSPHKPEVYLIRIDPLSGALEYHAAPGRDLFSSHKSAEDYLQTLGNAQIEGSGIAVLGYVVVGYKGLLLLVEKAKTTAVLPGLVNIKTITTCKWYRIPCQADLTVIQQIEISANIETIENRINKIIEFPLQGAHWYSQDADVSRPFPSSYQVTRPSWQFVWNEWLSQSFRSIGLGVCCPAVMEGTAESRGLRDVMGDPFVLVLLSRRSRLNAGTRYIARGLNDLCEPGNEIECEQIVWRSCRMEGTKKVLWNRYSWRRGTVPIRWGVTLKSGGLGEAEIHIRKPKTFDGCKKYIRRTQKRFYPNQEIEKKLKKGESDSADQSSSTFPIVFVSLLRKGLPDKNRSETNLAAAFDKALSTMRKSHGLNVAYYSLDWHEMDKQLGTHELIEALWITMKSVLQKYGLASGSYRPNHDQDDDKADPLSATSDWCGAQTIHWCSQQQGLARYNCADSLDRTNIASFFISVQVFVEQCRLLQLAVLTQRQKEAVTTRKPKSSIKERLLGVFPSIVAPIKMDKELLWSANSSYSYTHSDTEVPRKELPVGWESKVDTGSGRTYYIDHVNKETSWTLPTDGSQSERSAPVSSSVEGGSSASCLKSFKSRCQEEILSKDAWSMLDMTVNEIRNKVLPEPLASLAEVFLLNGDRNSFFYTGSQAMHSDRIMVFEPENSRLRKIGIGGAGNSLVAMQRRYNNLMRDNDRQAQIELFLGINLEKHLAGPTNQRLKDLDDMNIIYKPQKLELDFLDTDDDDNKGDGDDQEEKSDDVRIDDGKASCGYPNFARESSSFASETDVQTLETRRSRSSPMLDRMQFSTFDSSMDDLESKKDTNNAQSQPPQPTPSHVPGNNNAETVVAPSDNTLVPGLRSLPIVNSNPLSE